MSRSSSLGRAETGACMRGDSVMMSAPTRVASPFQPSKLFAHYDRLIGWLQTGKTSAPVTLELDVTNACNANCPACSGGRTARDAAWDISPDGAVWLFRDLVDAGVRAIQFTGGGEPTLHPNLPEYMYAARQAGLEVGLNTNGVHLPERTLDAIVTCCTWVRVSLAPTVEIWHAQTGLPARVFATVLDNVARLAARRRSDMVIGTAILTDARVMPWLQEGVETAARAGATYIQFRPFHNDTTPLDRGFYRALQRRYADRIAVLAVPSKYGTAAGRTYGACYGHHFTSVVQADYRFALCCHKRGEDASTWGDLRRGFGTNWDSAERWQAVETINVQECMPQCRCDGINALLWDLRQAGGFTHENFL